MTEVYVAFSIHGTDCFITANKQLANSDSLTVHDGITFKIGQSRTSSLRGATKLLADELTDPVSGQPLTDPVRVKSFFDKLGANGWRVDSAKFDRRFGLTPAKTTESHSTATLPDATQTSAPVQPDLQAVIRKLGKNQLALYQWLMVNRDKLPITAVQVRELKLFASGSNTEKTIVTVIASLQSKGLVQADESEGSEFETSKVVAVLPEQPTAETTNESATQTETEVANELVAESPRVETPTEQTAEPTIETKQD